MIATLTFSDDLIADKGAKAEWRDGCQYRKDLPAATGEWSNRRDGRPAALWFTCPCGCGLVGAVPVKPTTANGWEWNGSLDKPTTTPSIQLVSGCRWHGYLTDGVFKSC